MSSAIFTIHNASGSWYQAITDLCRPEKEGGLQIVRVTVEREVVCTTGQPLAIEAFVPDGGEIQILVKYGVRGVILTPLSAPVCELKLNVFSSASDWQAGYRILREALSHGASVTAGEASVDGDSLTDAGALDQHAAAWSEAQPAVAAKLSDVEASAMLPMMGRALLVSADDLALPAERLEKLLSDRAERYSLAYEASLMNFPGPKGQPVYVANFPHFATLVPKMAQAVTFEGRGGRIIEAFVPLSVFRDLLGGRVEDAGDFWYVPEVDFAEEPALVVELQKHEGEIDVVSGPRDVSPNVRQMIFSQQTTGEEEDDGADLTEVDWRFLQNMPTLIFLLVGGADGSINAQKTEIYTRLLEKVAGDPDGEDVAGRMFALAAEDISGSLQQLTGSIKSSRDHMSALGKLRSLLDRKLDASDAKNVKTALIELAKKIALQSSSRLYGPKVRQEEKAAVNLVRQSLGGK